MADRFQLRRDVSTEWETVNPILAAGEVAVELDTARFKIGNGTDTYTTLPYYDHTASILAVHTDTQDDELNTLDPHPQYVLEQDLQDTGIQILPFHSSDEIWAHAYYDQTPSSLDYPAEFEYRIDNSLLSGAYDGSNLRASWALEEVLGGLAPKISFVSEYVNGAGQATPVGPFEVELMWNIFCLRDSQVSFYLKIEENNPTSGSQFRFYANAVEQTPATRADGTADTNYIFMGPFDIPQGQNVLTWRLLETDNTPTLQTARMKIAGIQITPQDPPNEESVFINHRYGTLHTFNEGDFYRIDGQNGHTIQIPSGRANTDTVFEGIAIGNRATVTHENAVAIGNQAQSYADDSITLGSNEYVVNHATPVAIELTQPGTAIALRSPDGSVFRITVSDGGALVVTPF